LQSFEAGDIWYFPRGYGHCIATLGSEPCLFILVKDNGHFSDHATFSITDWIGHTPPAVLAANFGLPSTTFGQFAQAEANMTQGAVIPLDSPQARPNISNTGPLSHKYALMRRRPRHDLPYGTLHLATVAEFPISATMAGGVMRIRPGAMREMHWHPNANEWHYYLGGTAEVGLFASRGQYRIEAFAPGDVAYVPAGFGHYIRNTGSEDVVFVIAFDSGTYQEIELTDWIAATPHHLLANNFGVSETTFAAFPKATEVFRPG
jgi:oxalate decarboxylase